MDGRSLETADIGGVAATAPPQLPSQNALRWLIGLRLVVISTLFLGILTDPDQQPANLAAEKLLRSDPL